MLFILSVGLLSIISALCYAWIDWGARKLTDQEKETIDRLMQMLLFCASTKEDNDFLRNLHATTVTGIFIRTGNGEDDCESETRSGRIGQGTRTILRSDFFEDNRENQFMTLIHESYHAGTKDWSEEKSYDYAYDKFYAMGDCLQ